MVLIKTRKDLLTYIEHSPEFQDMKREIEDDNESDQIKDELMRLLAAGDKECPDFGEDWEGWLVEKFEDMLNEAVSIIA